MIDELEELYCVIAQLTWLISQSSALDTPHDTSITTQVAIDRDYHTRAGAELRQDVDCTYLADDQYGFLSLQRRGWYH